MFHAICMKCQILFSGKNKKNISKCCLLKILPRVLSIRVVLFYFPGQSQGCADDVYSVYYIIVQKCYVWMDHLIHHSHDEQKQCL